MSEWMCLVILMEIRWLGILESAEINSFFTIRFVPIKTCWHFIIHTWIVFRGTTLQTLITIVFPFPSHWEYCGFVWQLNIVLLLSSEWYCCVLIAIQNKWSLLLFTSFLLTAWTHPVTIMTIEWMPAYFPRTYTLRVITNILQISSFSLEISAFSITVCTESFRRPSWLIFNIGK